MVAFLITSALILAGITYAIYLWQRPSTTEDAGYPLPPTRSPGLFTDDDLSQTTPRELSAGEVTPSGVRQSLIARASAGEKSTLEDANATGDASLYNDVLDALIERAESDKSLLALVSYIVRSDANLRVSNHLAERFIESWKSSPDRNSTAKMLHVAALAGDASLYQRAVEAAYESWSDGSLQQISADELRQLIEGEFWILPPEVRSSGAGFMLKRKLAQLRRKLE